MYYICRVMREYYRIANHYIALDAEENSALWNSLPNYAPFAVEAPDVTAKILTSLEIVEELPAGEGNILFDSAEPGFPRLLIKREGENWIIDMAPESKEPFVATLFANANLSKAKLKFISRSQRTMRFAVDNALMLLFAFAGAAEKTLEIHSSVVVNQSKGYAFLGKSGTGKSTHSRLWMENIEGTRLLNDDNPVIRIENGTPIIYGSPWSGKTPCYKNEGYPLGAVVQLKQMPENRIRRLSPIEAYSTLFSSTSAFREIKSLAENLHKTFEEVITKVPLFQLGCLPDAAAAELCHRTIACSAIKNEEGR